jgi:hypothetical protein
VDLQVETNSLSVRLGLYIIWFLMVINSPFSILLFWVVVSKENYRLDKIFFNNLIAFRTSYIIRI